MRFPDFNYEFIGKLAVIIVDGEAIGYIEGKKDPIKPRGVLYYGYPGGLHRQGMIIIKDTMGCVARDVSMIHKKQGKLARGMYGEDLKKHLTILVASNK